MASTRCRGRLALLAVLALAALAVAACVLGEAGAGSAVPAPVSVADSSGEVPAGGDSGGAADGEAGGSGEPDAPGAPGADAPSEGTRAGDAPGGVDGLVAEAGGSAVPRREWSVDEGVSRAAGDLLENYAARGDTTLAHAGWLDLLGSVWGCTVVGPGWVDLCFVERQGEDASRVSVLRMEVDQWREAYGNTGPQGGS
ncbi:hypothetical protein [uncultured Parolsenella sp.]|uniref:hypothetical protein n=1 Tax=uncultured Parolsenella sp. TaxID=2083008 RepID=UPI00265A8934|nr:hypothetical protein [uncultured Parolsenella sp.]